MKVVINENECAGCNMCGSITGEVICVDEGGKAKLNPEADLKNQAIIEAVKMAAQVCPSQAITITETDA